MTKESPLEKSEKPAGARAMQKTARSAKNGQEGKCLLAERKKCGQGKTNAGTREVVRSRATSREKTHAR